MIRVAVRCGSGGGRGGVAQTDEAVDKPRTVLEVGEVGVSREP